VIKARGKVYSEHCQSSDETGANSIKLEHGLEIIVQKQSEPIHDEILYECDQLPLRQPDRAPLSGQNANVGEVSESQGLASERQIIPSSSQKKY